MRKTSPTTITDRYINPYDNLLYAILIQAVRDSKSYYMQDECMRFLRTTGKQIYEYLRNRPKHTNNSQNNGGYLTEINRGYTLARANKIKSKKGSII